MKQNPTNTPKAIMEATIVHSIVHSNKSVARP